MRFHDDDPEVHADRAHGAVPKMLALLETELDLMERAFDGFVEAVSPVLRPAHPEENTVGDRNGAIPKSDREPSEVAAQLDRLLMRVRLHRERVQRQYERVDL